MGNIIAIYQGSSANIPKGWKLCDGSNGTPNLVGRFIKGASNDEDIGKTGGALEHTHALMESPSHSHPVTGTAGRHKHHLATGTTPKELDDDVDDDRSTDEQTHTHNDTSTSSGHIHTASNASSVPLYYVLCYIMAEEVDAKYDFPIGAITMYTGRVADIPDGWAMCNGTNGTIDLRDRFVYGNNTKGSYGGSSSHTHKIVPSGSHSHTIASTEFLHTHGLGSASSRSRDFYPGGCSISKEGPAHTHSMDSAGTHIHTVSEASNDPPYYKLAFIQKIA